MPEVVYTSMAEARFTKARDSCLSLFLTFSAGFFYNEFVPPAGYQPACNPEVFSQNISLRLEKLILDLGG